MWTAVLSLGFLLALDAVRELRKKTVITRKSKRREEWRCTATLAPLATDASSPVERLRLSPTQTSSADGTGRASPVSGDPADGVLGVGIRHGRRLRLHCEYDHAAGIEPVRLSSEEYVDVVAYILQRNGYAPGDTIADIESGDVLSAIPIEWRGSSKLGETKHKSYRGIVFKK